MPDSASHCSWRAHAGEKVPWRRGVARSCGSIALEHLPGSALVCGASLLIARDRAVLHKPALLSPWEVTDTAVSAAESPAI